MFYGLTNHSYVARNVAVKLAVRENLLAVRGPQVAVDLAGGGRRGLPGSGNTVSNWREISADYRTAHPVHA